MPVVGVISTCIFAALWSRANPSTAGRVRDRRANIAPPTIPHPGRHDGSARTMTCPNSPAGAQATSRGPQHVPPASQHFEHSRSARVHFETDRSGRITYTGSYQGPRTAAAKTVVPSLVHTTSATPIASCRRRSLTRNANNWSCKLNLNSEKNATLGSFWRMKFIIGKFFFHYLLILIPQSVTQR